MSNLKISQLTAGNPAQSGDLVPIDRAGANFSITAGSIAALASSAVSSVFGRTGAVVAVSGDYTVGQVTGAAPLASPTFTGVPAAPTAAGGTNTTQLATTAFVTAAVAAAPVTSVFGRTGAVVAVSGDYTVAQVTGAAPLASPALTGTPTAPTAAPGTNTTQIASTAFVTAAVAASPVLSVFGRTGAVIAVSGDYTVGQVTGAAPLASPTFTGTPAAPTATVGTNTTQLATTAFVIANAGTGTVTSVGFTGGLISVATATTTPALTVAGTSGGIPYFSSASTWATSAALASGGVVLGGGSGTAPATNTHLTFATNTLTVGLAGTGSGIVALAGSTSGSATITAPATAGTATNPITISNSLQLPSGTVYNWNADTGLSRDSAAVIDVGNGTAGDVSGSLKLTGITMTGVLANSLSPAVSQSALSITGSPQAGGTTTTSFPLVYFNNGAAPTTLNAFGTYLGFNVSNGFSGNVLDVHINGGVSTFSLTSNGLITTSGGVTATGAVSGASLTANSAGLTVTAGGATIAGLTTITGGNVKIDTGQGYTFVGGTGLFRAANGVLILQNDAGTGFTRLDFGGTTSSFVSLQSSGTTLTVGLANNTAGGTLAASTLSLVGTVSKYNNLTTVRNGVAAEYISSDLTAQSAAITSTVLVSSGSSYSLTGVYRINWSATITTAATTSSVLGGTNGFQVIYTSPTDSVVKTTVAGASVTSAANTTGTAIGGSLIIYSKAVTNISYTFDYTSVGVTAMVYELHISLEAL